MRNSLRSRSPRDARTNRSGSIILLAAGMMIMVFGFLAFTVDVGYIALTKAQLEAASVAGSRAAHTNCAMAWDSRRPRPRTKPKPLPNKRPSMSRRPIARATGLPSMWIRRGISEWAPSRTIPPRKHRSSNGVSAPITWSIDLPETNLSKPSRVRATTRCLCSSPRSSGTTMRRSRREQSPLFCLRMDFGFRQEAGKPWIFSRLPWISRPGTTSSITMWDNKTSSSAMRMDRSVRGAMASRK